VNKKQGIPIRLDFCGDDAKRFEAVKRHLGLSQNTEVIRALVSEKYNEVAEKSEA